MKRSYFFGIDFGTTMSSIAVGRSGEFSMPECIEFSNNRRIETVVRLSRDGRQVEAFGNSAWEDMGDHPTATFYNFKPFVGTNTEWTRGRTTIAVDSLARMYLEHLRLYLQRHLNMTDLAVESANSTSVIGHPADWPADRIDKLRRIASEAGFPNVTTCPEPEAAVHRHLGDLESDDEHVFLVYDFGGGTTDIAVCRFRGGKGEILYRGGDACLGGSDYDKALVRYFFAELGISSPWPVDQATMYRQAKRIKESLSSKINDATGKEIKTDCTLSEGRYTLTLDGERFEKATADLIACFSIPVRDYLKNGSIPINTVVATGGSSHLYFVGERLKSLLPECRLYHARFPQESIAIGLALSKRTQPRKETDRESPAGPAPDLAARNIRKRLCRELAELINDMSISKNDFLAQRSAKRSQWINQRLKEFHLITLKWGQLNGLIPPESYEGKVADESDLGKYLVSIGLMAVGGGGAAAALLTGLATVSTTVAAPGVVGSALAYLGLTGTFGLGTATMVTTTWPIWVTAAAAAAPVVIAGLGIFAFFSFSRNKQYNKAMEKVAEAKKKTREFFESQIDQAEYESLLFSDRARMTKWD